MKERVIALGFFDGVHLGHGALLRRAAEEAALRGCTPAVFTFDRPPKEVVTGVPCPLINSPEDRRDLVRRLYRIQDVLMSIQMGKTVDDPTRMKFETQEFYIKDADEMAALFDYIPEAISNTRVIADKIEEPVFDLKTNGTPIRDTSLIPLYTPDDGSTSPEYLTRLTWEGLPKRYKDMPIISSSSGTISTGRA